MGAFGRAGEKVKQAFCIGVPNDKEWKPTTNARNRMMLKDMKEFSVHVRRMHADVSLWRDTVERGLITMKGVLEVKLPRAFVETSTGVAPFDPETHVVGQGCRTEVFAQAVATMQGDIQKILSSLEGWLNSYKEIKARNNKCEVLKVDVDARHREAAHLLGKYQKVIAAGKHDEDLKFRLMAAEDKNNRLAQRYAETETEVYNALLSKIQDSTALRDYVYESLLNMKLVFEAAVGAVDVRAAIRPPMLPPMATPEFKSMNTFDNRPAQATQSLGSASALTDNRASLRMSNGGPQPIQPVVAQAATYGKTPKWYDDARSQAGMPVEDADDSDEDANPFAKARRGADNRSLKSEASNPFGPSKAKSQASNPWGPPKAANGSNQFGAKKASAYKV